MNYPNGPREPTGMRRGRSGPGLLLFPRLPLLLRARPRLLLRAPGLGLLSASLDRREDREISFLLSTFIFGPPVLGSDVGVVGLGFGRGTAGFGLGCAGLLFGAFAACTLEPRVLRLPSGLVSL